ncbi:MAG: gamma-glutamyl-gamma-aminobutyrate hydrolase family protein [Deltaproteobacteria bacterium]|nr:gamma-glutamyl-gamma-aminobutyrate hydrolase family protein [Deltaproteobacteria bacterium]
MSRPIVLVSPDRDFQKTRRGDVPIHVLDQRYAWAVQRAGGLPIVAPYTEDAELLEQTLDLCHGVLLTGGDFDVDPGLFHEARHPSLGKIKDDRTAFESAMLEGAIKRNLPVLGICGGMQLMNVLVEKGTLWQDLPSQNKSDVEHEQVASKNEAGHVVHIVEGSRLASVFGVGDLGVNSTHHQAIRDVGIGLQACAFASDDVVEAIEKEGNLFFVGVQWHPEAMVDDERQQKLYSAFVQAAQLFQNQS